MNRKFIVGLIVFTGLAAIDIKLCMGASSVYFLYKLADEF